MESLSTEVLIIVFLDLCHDWVFKHNDNIVEDTSSYLDNWHIHMCPVVRNLYNYSCVCRKIPETSVSIRLLFTDYWNALLQRQMLLELQKYSN